MNLNEHQAKADELNFTSYFRQVLARKTQLTAGLILFFLLGIFMSLSEDEEFTANAVVQFEERDEQIALPEAVLSDFLQGGLQGSTLETEFHVIKSGLILERVIDQIDLNTYVVPEEAPVFSRQYRIFLDLVSDSNYFSVLSPWLLEGVPRSDEHIEIEELYFSSGIESAKIRLKAVDETHVSIAVHLDGGTPASEKIYSIGSIIQIEPYVQFRIKQISASPGRIFWIVKESAEATADKIAENLIIQERGGRVGTGIVDFSYKSNNSQASTLTLKTIIDEYKAQSLSRRSAEIDQGIVFVENQIPIAEANLSEAVRRLNEHVSGTALENGELSIATQEVLSRIVSAETLIQELAFEKSQLLLTVTENHPDFQRLEAEEAEVIRRLSTLKNELKNVPRNEQKLVQLTAEVEKNQEVYSQLTSRLEQLRMLGASKVSSIRLLEMSSKAQLTGPNRKQTILGILLLGLIITSIFIIWRNYSVPGIKDIGALDSCGADVFAVLPKIHVGTPRKSTDANYWIVNSDPTSLTSEAFRGLRTALQFTLPDAGIGAICITSSAPNEGKSFTSLNLATVVAQTGKKVLLIDADMRRGELAKVFGMRRDEPGLSALLAGRYQLKDVVKNTAVQGLNFIGTGGYPPNPSELLSSIKLKEELARMKAEFDLVIFDCPPVLAVTDPVIVSTLVERTFLVCAHLKTPLSEIATSIQSIQLGSGVAPGVIVNAYDQSKVAYGKYGAKYGQYHGYYSYSYSPKKSERL